eukprot:765949-Hanusia_phi.AAC.5
MQSDCQVFVASSPVGQYDDDDASSDAKFHPHFDSAAVGERTSWPQIRSVTVSQGNTEGKGKVVAAATSSADLKVSPSTARA